MARPEETPGRIDGRRRIPASVELGALFVVVVGVSLGHYLTPVGDHMGHEFHSFHSLYQWCYHLPIILAGFRFGLRGGVGFAALVTVLYIPHVVFQWGGGTSEQWLEIALYNVVGCVVGFLSARQRAVAMENRRAAEALDVAYAELKEKAQVLLETEEQLRQAGRLAVLGELSAGLAHEVRTPLSSIRGAAEILARDRLPEEQSREFTDILIREVDRLNRVVSNFLDYARPKGRAAETADLNQAVTEVLGLIRVPASKAGVEVRRDLAPDLPPVRGDGAQLQQVVLNLVMNSLQAMEGGGILSVSSAGNGDGAAELRVEDTGKGIPPGLLPRIFDPFVTGRPGGTGLGLSIVRRILANHGARIRVDSEPGRGTTMTIDFLTGEPGI